MSFHFVPNFVPILFLMTPSQSRVERGLTIAHSTPTDQHRHQVISNSRLTTSVP
jgi:hypothetical protein